MRRAPAETLRLIPKAALSRIARALEDRGLRAKLPWEAVAPPAPAEELVVVGRRWEPSPASIPGLDLCAPRQLELLEQMRRFATDLPDSPAFASADAFSLYLMMKVVAPRRIFTLGSTAGRELLLDVIDRSSDPPVELTSVERRGPVERFREISAGDILHAETSALEELLFDVLPALSAGVFIQLRPVFYPFKEVPLLRAFLQYNREFQIRFWPSYLYQHARDRLARIPRICADSGTIWIRKVG